MNKLGPGSSRVKPRPQISSQQAGTEQEELGPRVPTGKKECAIFETSSASARSAGVLCLGGKKNIFHMHTVDLLSEGQGSNFILVRYQNIGYFS